jgi:hypothetical protein
MERERERKIERKRDTQKYEDENVRSSKKNHNF